MNAAHLIQRCQEGDSLAIEALVCDYRGVVYRLARSILDDPAEADEATQDVFIAALKGLNSYRAEASLTTWLYVITLNVCRRRLHKRQGWERLKQQLLSLFHAGGDGTTHPEERVILNERDTAMWIAIQALGEKQRLPVILYYYYDLPVAEIAQVLDVNPGTVLSRLYTARERLRPALRDMSKEESYD